MMHGNMKMGEMKGKVCACPHHKMLSLLTVVFGLVFLLGGLNVLTSQTVNIIWPILVIIAGGTKLFEEMCKCC